MLPRRVRRIISTNPDATSTYSGRTLFALGSRANPLWTVEQNRLVAFTHPFANRAQAGVELARLVGKSKLKAPIVVLGLPRGGIPVAYEIARALHAPLDIMPVRKISMPYDPEFAIGAIAGAETVVRTQPPAIRMTDRAFRQLVDSQRAELERRERAYRSGLPPLDLKGKTAVLVDDGLATGNTMVAAVREARRLQASSVAVCAPVSSDSAAALVRAEADHFITLKVTAALSAVGAWYVDFHQVSDAEVVALLEQARREAGALSA